MKTRRLLLMFVFILILSCSKENDTDPLAQQAGNPVYLDANGITVKAREWAKVGDKGKINGIEYTVVDEPYLRGISILARVQYACTTKVTNMDALFAGDLTMNPFNGDISSWDVSNVTSMRGMFFHSAFNKPIGVWDVSKVTDMSSMFEAALDFNQDLSGWSVANVSDCSNFSNDAIAWITPKPDFTGCTNN